MICSAPCVSAERHDYAPAAGEMWLCRAEGCRSRKVEAKVEARAWPKSLQRHRAAAVFALAECRTEPGLPTFRYTRARTPYEKV